MKDYDDISINIEYPLKKTDANFLNIYRIEKWEYKFG